MTGTAAIADLIGGPASGKSLPMTEDRPVIRLPARPPERGVAGYWADDDAPLEAAYRIVTYRRCGIRDDGRRIYAYDARSSNA